VERWSAGLILRILENFRCVLKEPCPAKRLSAPNAAQRIKSNKPLSYVIMSSCPVLQLAHQSHLSCFAGY
jgi:hypothetical protein